MKYALYARKSTEGEERQVLSIEAQLAELTEFASKENLEIANQPFGPHTRRLGWGQPPLKQVRIFSHNHRQSVQFGF